MVFTEPVHSGNLIRDRRVPRRAVIGAAFGAAAALAGCELTGHDHRPAHHPDPLEPLLAATLVLADRYQAALAVTPRLAPRLAPILAAHRAHAATVAAMIGARPASATPVTTAGTPTPGSSDADLLAGLASAERDGYEQAVAACLAAPAARAAVLGSIAAARASFREALR